jgi:hypothetical protein
VSAGDNKQVSLITPRLAVQIPPQQQEFAVASQLPGKNFTMLGGIDFKAWIYRFSLSVGNCPFFREGFYSG